MQKAWRIFKKVFLWLFILQFVYILFCKWINPPITITQALNYLQGNWVARDYIGFDEMGSNIKLAVIASEDQLFPDHEGFDTVAIRKALKYNEKHTKTKRGGSTISQQVAKNVFLWQHGGYLRKGLEVYFTFMIEKAWNKKRILETYLNVAEMGKGVFGVQAAAKSYFNKDAKNLTRTEAAVIASFLPNPKVYSLKPYRRNVVNRYNNILRQMNNIDGDPNIEELVK